MGMQLVLSSFIKHGSNNVVKHSSIPQTIFSHFYTTNEGIVNPIPVIPTNPAKLHSREHSKWKTKLTKGRGN